MRREKLDALLTWFQLILPTEQATAPVSESGNLKLEYIDEDPKDGELYLGRIKPGETLVEVRRDANVQIARRI